jgi:hypothetical protein
MSVRRRATLRALPAAVFIFSAAVPAWSRPDNSCERALIRASRAHDVPLGVLYAVGLTETGSRKVMRPYLLNVEGRPMSTTTMPEAIANFNDVRRRGAVLIDIGCMQINHYFHRARFDSLEAMFDPVKNVDYAARFLKELRAREGSWTLAVARYNAGPNNNPAQKQYVCRVIGNMIASGLGSWTGPARAFCQAAGADPAANEAASTAPRKR